MAGRTLRSLACVPSEATLTRVVSAVWRSRTKMSISALVSPGTRLVAMLWKATTRPSLLVAGPELGSLPCVPSEATLTSDVDAAAATAEGAQATASTIDSDRQSPTTGARRRERARIAIATTTPVSKPHARTLTRSDGADRHASPDFSGGI